VGDREHDVRGAKACGVRAIGVTYGYGSREELVAAGADYIVESPIALLELLGAGVRREVAQ
jgi:phosphoglycolate phosphatase